MSENNTPSPANGTPAPAAARTRSALWPVLGIVAALAAGGAAAAKVEIPGVASSGSPSREVGRFFETQSSTGQRYTVTLPNGTKIQEVNNVTAAQMVPFDSVTFTGHFNSMTDVSTEVAKRAAEKGAKYYHVTRQWQNKSGGNLTVSADLFK